MPIFEYLCRKCGKQFEVFQRITDNPLKACSFCQGKVSRVVETSPSVNEKIAVLKPVYKKVEKKEIRRKAPKRASKSLRKRA